MTDEPAELAMTDNEATHHCERSEAIHNTKPTGLLRRFAPRNDGCAAELAMTDNEATRHCEPSCHCERSEAIHNTKPTDCFVALLLAMTDARQNSQ